jgi:hypothetical protein
LPPPLRKPNILDFLLSAFGVVVGGVVLDFDFLRVVEMEDNNEGEVGELEDDDNGEADSS